MSENSSVLSPASTSWAGQNILISSRLRGTHCTTLHLNYTHNTARVMCSQHSTEYTGPRARAPRPRSPPAARPPSSVYRGEGAERAQDGRLTRRRTRASLCGRGRCTRREREKETPLTAKSARRRAMACARCRGASRKRRKRRASSAAEVARAPRALREGGRRAHRERRRRAACLRSRMPAHPRGKRAVHVAVEVEPLRSAHRPGWSCRTPDHTQARGHAGRERKRQIDAQRYEARSKKSCSRRPRLGRRR